MGFLSRVVSHIMKTCVWDQVFSHHRLFWEPHSPSLSTNAWGIQGLKAQKRFTLFKVYSFYLLAPACPFSPLEIFPFAKKKLQLNWCRKEVLPFLILPGTNTSRTIPSWDSRISG